MELLVTLPIIFGFLIGLVGIAQLSRIELALSDAANGAATVWSRAHSSAEAIATAQEVLLEDGLATQQAQIALDSAGSTWSVTVAYPVTVWGWPRAVFLKAQRSVVAP